MANLSDKKMIEIYLISSEINPQSDIQIIADGYLYKKKKKNIYIFFFFFSKKVRFCISNESSGLIFSEN